MTLVKVASFRDRIRGTLLSFAKLLLVLACVTLPCLAQESIFSSIRGIVTDQSGAIVPGAKVELLNQGTTITRSAVSASDGGYQFESIVSGMYTITVEATGFKKHVQSNIDLKNSKTIRIDTPLEVGTVAQQITVTGSTPLETEVPTISVSLDKQKLSISAVGGGLNYRILQTYYNIVPGGISGAYNGGGALNGMPLTGFSERSSIDGIRVLSTCCQSTPASGTLDEMKMVTYNAGAEYAVPSTMELITKQGGNKFHGNAWWLYADKGLDARDPTKVGKVLQHSNSLGGEIGGPVIKKKVFAYFSFEGVRLNNTITTDRPVVTASLPTTLMQQGDFSQLIDPAWYSVYNHNTPVTVKDPLTGVAFPNNIIPANRISSVSQAVVSQYYTAPQLPGIVNNQYLQAVRPNRRDKWDLRGDYAISDKHHLMARYGWSLYVGSQQSTGLTQATANDGKLTFLTHNGAIAETWTISPTMTNEIKYGFSVMPIQGASYAQMSQDIMGALGIQGSNGQLGLPGITVSGLSGWAGLVKGNTAYNTQTFADSFSIVHGKHFLKFGVQTNFEATNSRQAAATPTFTFNGALSGFAWADFMLGYPSSINRAIAPANAHYTQRDWGFYAQDEIRVTRTLNITVGLRYQIWPYSSEVADRMAIFSPALQAIIVPSAFAQQQVVPTFPIASIPVLTAAQANYPAQNRALANTDYGAWAPRLGIAWRPFGGQKTVIRGGYGIYYWNTRTGGAAAGGSVFSGSQTLTQQLVGGILTPIMQFPNPFTAFTSGSVNTLDPTTLSFTAADPNLKMPYVQDWNVTVERDLGGQATVRVSYMGTREIRNQFGYNINEAPMSTLAFAQSRRPIPLVRDISFLHNGGFPHSNELQVVFDRRLNRGMGFNAAFTWLHKITDLNIFGGGALETGLDRFRSNPSYVTPRKQLILSYQWEVPVGRKRKFGSSLPAVADGILGGWQIVGITKFESGQYTFPTYTGVNPAGTTPGTGSQIPDRIGNGNLSGSTRAVNARTAVSYFDPTAYQCPGGSTINGAANLLSAGCPLSANLGRFGNSELYQIGLPGVNGWILTAVKTFRLYKDSTNLEFSGVFTNPFNHPNWAGFSTNLSSPSNLGIITGAASGGIDPFSLSRRRIQFQMKVIF